MRSLARNESAIDAAVAIFLPSFHPYAEQGKHRSRRTMILLF